MNVEDYLRQQNIGFERHEHRPTFTSQDLAAAEHVSGYDVAKPVVVKAGDAFTMCVLPACMHLDIDRVAEALGRKDVRLATEQEMSELFPGCELGAEPPIGTMFDLQTIVEERLLEDETLTMQAGSHTEAIRLRCDDWRKICNPKIASIGRA